MPKKLKLDLDTLHVESFDTRPGEAKRGTVAGFDVTEQADSCIAGSFCLICNSNDLDCQGPSGNTVCDTQCYCGPGPTVDPNNAYCTFENCSAETWCYAGCSYNC